MDGSSYKSKWPFQPILEHSATSFDHCVGFMKDFQFFFFTKLQLHPKFQKLNRWLQKYTRMGVRTCLISNNNLLSPKTPRGSHNADFPHSQKYSLYLYSNILHLLTQCQINCMGGSSYDLNGPFYPF